MNPNSEDKYAEEDLIAGVYPEGKYTEEELKKLLEDSKAPLSRFSDIIYGNSESNSEADSPANIVFGRNKPEDTEAMQNALSIMSKRYQAETPNRNNVSNVEELGKYMANRPLPRTPGVWDKDSFLAVTGLKNDEYTKGRDLQADKEKRLENIRIEKQNIDQSMSLLLSAPATEERNNQIERLKAMSKILDEARAKIDTDYAEAESAKSTVDDTSVATGNAPEVLVKNDSLDKPLKYPAEYALPFGKVDADTLLRTYKNIPGRDPSLTDLNDVMDKKITEFVGKNFLPDIEKLLAKRDRAMLRPYFNENAAYTAMVAAAKEKHEAARVNKSENEEDKTKADNAAEEYWLNEISTAGADSGKIIDRIKKAKLSEEALAAIRSGIPKDLSWKYKNKF
jgi:hypothetical protein